MIPFYFYSFILLFLLIAYIIKQSFSFHSDSPNDPSRVSHTDCPARINSQKNGLNLLFLSHYDAFPTLLWNIRVGQDNIRDGFLTRGVAIRVCLNECVARVILTAVIIIAHERSPNSPRPWSSTPCCCLSSLQCCWSDSSRPTHVSPLLLLSWNC